MKVSVIGCGESAKDWNKVPVDLSIGVNDAFKFGHPIDYLVCVNSPLKFFPTTRNGNTDRIKTIIETNPKRFFVHDSRWQQHVKHAELISFRPFNLKYVKNRVYSSKTSPFVAITLAASLGATEIIIWGVDMINHHKFSANSGKRHQEDFQIELSYYMILFEELAKHGVQCFIGNENTVLKQYLPIWNPVK
jgi:hypothetical protein